MKFYCISDALDNKVVGRYPQVENALYSCDVWIEPQFVDRVNFVKTDFQPIVANAILREGAKLTDLISGGIVGFTLKLLMSGKLKKILQLYRTSGLQFYRSPVLFEESLVEDYWVLNPYEIDMDFIDFRKTEVFLMKNTFTRVEKLDIQSYKDFTEFKSKINLQGYPFSIAIENLRLSNNINQDFFTLLMVEGGVKYIVSEKLKEKIETEGCTGIEFMPVELSLNQWLIRGGAREQAYGKV